MLIASLRYGLRASQDAIRRAPVLGVATTLSIAAALFICGAFGAAVQNLENLLTQWGHADAVHVYFDENALPDAYEHARSILAGMEGARDVAIITPAQAHQRLSEQGPASRALMEGIAPALLPASLEVTLRSPFQPQALTAKLAQAARALPSVESVDYGEHELVRLRGLVSIVKYAGLALWITMGAAVALLVANTIRLTVVVRQSEIELMRLLGATRAFVSAPFLAEGVIWGFLGGALSGLALYSSDVFLKAHLTQTLAEVTGGFPVHLYAPNLILSLCGMGCAMGLVGSLLALGRVIADEPS